MTLAEESIAAMGDYFCENSDGTITILDCVSKKPVRGNGVPDFIQAHKTYADGVAFLASSSHAIACQLWLVRHVTAEDLGAGDSFEKAL